MQVVEEIISQVEDLPSDTIPSNLDLDMSTLMRLGKGVWHFHSSWIPNLQLVCASLLSQISRQPHHEESKEATFSFLALPQLLQLLLEGKKNIPEWLALCAISASPWRTISLEISNLYVPRDDDGFPTQRRRPAARNPRELGKRVTQCLDSERFGTAMREVESYNLDSPPLPDWHTQVRQVQELHPPASPRDRVTPGSTPVLLIRIEIEDLVNSAKNLNKNSARGCSFWSYRLITSLFHVGSPEPLLTAVAHFYEVLTTNGIPNQHLWGCSRLILIPKPDGKVRPIAIGEAWIRFLGRILSRRFSKQVGQFLAPLQLGVGIRGGCDIMSHLAQRAYESPDMTVATLDIGNAFNSLRRGYIADALQAHCPDLVPFFQWAYAQASPLLNSSGVSFGVSATGVRQGDPLGPLYFCLGFHFMTRHIQETLGPRCNVMAYMDDITIHGPAPILMEKYEEIVDFGRDHEINFNHAKSFIIADGPTPPDGLQRCDSLVCVGIPIGPEEFQVEKVKLMLEKGERSLQTIQLLPLQCGFPLLFHAMNGKFIHIIRNLPPPSFKDLLQHYDSQMDSTLAEMLGSAQLPPLAQTLRSLPIRVGGTGITRLDLIADMAYEATRVLVQDYIEEYYAATDWYQSYYRAIPEDILTVASNRKGSIQSALCGQIYNRKVEELLAQIVTPRQQQIAAWIRSSANPGSGGWLLAPPYLRKTMGLTETLYLEAFRGRLILPLKDGNPEEHCQRCHTRGHGNYPLHGLDCPETSSSRTVRHDAIRNLLQATITRQTQRVVQREHWVDGSTRADLFYWDSNRPTIIDVSIVNPAAASYIPKKAYAKRGAAAEDMVNGKRTRYRHLTNAGCVLIPFVLEATGLPSAPATNFLESLFGVQEKANMVQRQERRAFMVKLSIICAKFTGIMMRRARTLLIHAPTGNNFVDSNVE